jgi:hypothetical protein
LDAAADAVSPWLALLEYIVPRHIEAIFTLLAAAPSNVPNEKKEEETKNT